MRVYQFGLRAPIENEPLIREQLRAAHDYRNTLVAIERGRRHALRAIDDASDAVQEAKSVVKAATRSTRKAAVRELRAARKRAREAAADELAAIAEREHQILLSARADTTCYWGSYLDIEAAHRQSRQQPLYGDDALTPNDPAFARGPRWLECLDPGDQRAAWWLAHGQIGIQLQGGAETREILAGEDTRVRLVLDRTINRGRRAGMLWLRVGSEGRAPVWAKWPILVHRAIPDAARWKWVRVSLRVEAHREIWTCEITVDDPSYERIRALSVPGNEDTLAVQWEWSPLDDGSIRVARYASTASREVKEVVLPEVVAGGIRKVSGLRAVCDTMRNDMSQRLVRAIHEERRSLPAYVVDASRTMHLWRSSTRYVHLLMRWRRDGGSSKAYQVLHEWYEGTPHRCRKHPCREWHGERHLCDYEAGARGQALRRRREWYRVLASEWRARYRRVLVSDQDLSIAARWGDDSDVRFIAGVSELRTAIRNALGSDAIDARWRDGAAEDDEREWCERSLGAWSAGGARDERMFAERKESTRNAWAKRKETVKEKGALEGTAREPNGKVA